MNPFSQRPPSTALAALVAASAIGIGSCGGGGDSSPTNPPPPPDPPVVPNVGPTASFTMSVSEGTVPLEVALDATGSSDSDGSIATYAWDFGDGTTGSGQQSSHTFDGPGFFKVVLTVRDDDGAEDTAQDSVYVVTGPGAGTNRIRGTVWFDRDLDGVDGPDEPGLERFVVFLDQDGDGDHDGDEPLTFTAADGSYGFEGLDGTTSYTVTQQLPFGWSNTTPGTGPAPPPSRPEAPQPMAIINGEEADIADFPFQVALLSGNFQFCGGSLINSRYVLTAAHCVDGLVSQDVDILIGTSDLELGGTRVGTSAIRIHPDYSNSLANDVALLRLSEPLLMPRIFLQTPDQPSFSDPGQTATVIGWGQKEDGNSATKLLRVDVPLITNVECQNIAGAFFGGIGPETICAGGERLDKGPCFGDSGGPLMIRSQDSWIQVGVVSFAVNQDQCGNIPAAYARMTAVYDYIVAVARLEESGALVVDWSGGSEAVVDFGNYH